MKQINFSQVKTLFEKHLDKLKKKKTMCLAEKWVIDYNVLAINKALIELEQIRVEMKIAQLHS